MEIEERLIQILSRPTFEKNMAFMDKTRAGVPRTFDIDLSIPLTDQPYNIGGNILYVMQGPDSTSYIDVKFNALDSSAVRLYHAMGLLTPFRTLYITTPAAQTGTMTILTGIEAPDFLEIIDNRGATSLDMAQIRAELQGDTVAEIFGNEITVNAAAAVQILAANANAKGRIIQAKAANGGLVYIGPDNTVTTTKWWAELSAGMAFTIDDYRGTLFARASAVGQLVGYGEW